MKPGSGGVHAHSLGRPLLARLMAMGYHSHLLRHQYRQPHLPRKGLKACMQSLFSNLLASSPCPACHHSFEHPLIVTIELVVEPEELTSTLLQVSSNTLCHPKPAVLWRPAFGRMHINQQRSPDWRPGRAHMCAQYWRLLDRSRRACESSSVVHAYGQWQAILRAPPSCLQCIKVSLHACHLIYPSEEACGKYLSL